jgi:serine/threonine-protein kinase
LFSIDSQDLSGPGIYWIRADGAGEPQRLVEGSNLSPSSFLRDGTRFAYFRRLPNYGIWTVALDLSDSEHPKPGKPEVFLESNADLRGPAFSPDGKWMSYGTFESGASEGYVRPYPGPGGKFKIWSGGPSFWSQKMPQLFYQGGSPQQIWVASYTVKGGAFIADQPQAWAKAEQAAMADLMPDGKRFIAVLPAEAKKSDRNTHLTFLLNFADELNRRASDRK